MEGIRYYQALQGNMLLAYHNLPPTPDNQGYNNCPGLPAEVNASGLIVVKASVNQALDDAGYNFLQSAFSAAMIDLRFENSPFLCTRLIEQDLFTTLSLSYTVVSAVLTVLTLLLKVCNDKCNKLKSTSVASAGEPVVPVYVIASGDPPLKTNTKRSWTGTT